MPSPVPPVPAFMIRSLSRLAAAGYLAGGCYSYTPVALGAARPGTRLRAELTAVGSDSLARTMGPGITAVEGALLSASPQALTLALRAVRQQGQADQIWRGERVSVPTTAIAQVRERRLSRLRTGMVAVGAVLAGVGLRAVISQGGNADRFPGGGGGQQQ